ncbi:TIGR03086 family metal-binding protein [Kineosporia rhizophila]|uniref:TIGR03086 family metal-binding protein n=1 Tax=Kineosporia TaxID=49184 RepID=UPI001E6103D0|nr:MULTISPECIES: TIGR03086 family metal-binding protein [Kineosporia]MCE0534656.1 TIGR03086 family metal-binding protein [Kineosporia rhizophila]
MTNSSPAGLHLPIVLDQLADLLAQVKPEQYSAPTPCPEFDVSKLRSHILGWALFFGAVFERPQGTDERPDVEGYQAPQSPAEAAEVMRGARRQISAGVDAGVADEQVVMFGGPLPGSAGLGMCLGEYLVHGHDLAQATGLPWNPPAEAVAAALAFMPKMLTDEYRGPDKSFGYQVEVPGTASDLEKLVAFTGRDPYWQAA